MDFKKIDRIADSLTVDEKDYLFNVLARDKSEPLDKIIISDNGRPACPSCGTIMVKNGTKNGHQKRICPSCKKTCFTNSGRSTYYSKANAYIWYNFLKCEKMHFSLRKTCEICNINLQRAFYMRHKFQHILVDEMNKIKLNGRVEIDGFEYKINFKGTKPKNMPRSSKKRGTTNSKKSQKIIIIVGIDELDNIVAVATEEGPESRKNIDYIIPYIGRIDHLVTDDKSSYESFAKIFNCKHSQIKSQTYVNETGENMNTINGLMRELRSRLDKFNGVSIRHLQDYISEFVFFKTIDYTVEQNNQPSLLIKKTLSSHSIITCKEICQKLLCIDTFKIFN